MSHAISSSSTEHPLDVFTKALSIMSEGEKCALVFVTDILGGAVRARGAVMLVCENGQRFGYLSGGCIDADVGKQAQQAIIEEQFSTCRYGEGSPFYDLKLPCGGAIEVTICPNIAIAVLTAIVQKLANRKPVSIRISSHGQVLLNQSQSRNNSFWKNGSFYVTYQPKLQLRIAGRGADPIALANIANAAGIAVDLWSPDEATIAAAKLNGAQHHLHLKTPSSLATNNDDEWTAFVLMFHDSEWETALLQHALSGNAFYIGAVGSQKTHTKRSDALLKAGVAPSDISRIHGPIGLIPSLRDASMLAISALAEIVGNFQQHYSSP